METKWKQTEIVKKNTYRLMLKNNVCQVQGSHGLAAKTRSWNCFSTCVEQTHEILVFVVLWTG